MPGPYIKSFFTELGNEGLYKMASVFEDRSAVVQCTFTYIWSDTEEPIQFVGRMNGEIVPPKGESKYAWDPCFRPDGYSQTYGEMSLEMKNGISHYYKGLG